MATAPAQKTPYEHQRPANVEVREQLPSVKDHKAVLTRGTKPKSVPANYNAPPRAGAYQFETTYQKRPHNVVVRGDEKRKVSSVPQEEVAWDENYDLRPETVSEDIYERAQAARRERAEGDMDEDEALALEAEEEAYQLQQQDYEQYLVQQDMLEEEEIPSQRIRIKKPGHEETSLLVKAKVTKISLVITLTVTPFWAVQAYLALIGIIGLGIAGLVGQNVAILEGIQGAESFLDVIGTLTRGLFSGIINGISGLMGWLFGVDISDIGLAIYLGSSLIIFIIGICSIFYAWFMYALHGIDTMKGAGTAALFFSVGLYLIPLVQFFPWVLLFVFAVWWTHR